MTAAPDRSLDERYGRTRQRGLDRRLGWGLAAGAVVLGAAVLLFGSWRASAGIEFKELHYEVQDARTVSLDFNVTAPTEEPVACALEALSGSFSTVGWKVVELPPSAQLTRSFTETLATTYRAATARVYACWVIERPA